jgi:hypothetical protein
VTARQRTASEQTDEVSELRVSTGYAAPVVAAAQQAAAEHTDMPRPCARPDQARKPTNGGLDGTWS